MSVAESEGVGCVFVPSTFSFIKLYHRDGKLQVADYGRAKTEAEAKNYLQDSLGLGYEILVVSKIGNKLNFETVSDNMKISKKRKINVQEDSKEEKPKQKRKLEKKIKI